MIVLLEHTPEAESLTVFIKLVGNLQKKVRQLLATNVGLTTPIIGHLWLVD